MPRKTTDATVYRARAVGRVVERAFDHERHCWMPTGTETPFTLLVGPYKTPGAAKGAATMSAQQMDSNRATHLIDALTVEIGRTVWEPFV